MVSTATQYRLLDFMQKYKRGIIVGAPGIGKTLLTSWCSTKIASKDSNAVIIFSVPLRKLRDYIYHYFKDYGTAPFKLLAHDEYEPRLEQYVKNFGGYIAGLKHHLDNDQCAYHQHWQDLVDYVRSGGQIIVSTHKMGVWAWLLLKKRFKDKKITLIVDEGEDYFLKISEPIDPSWLESLRHLDKRIYRKIRSGLKKYRDYYFYNPLFVQRVVFHSFVISATMPRSMMEVLVDEYDYPVYQMKGKKSRDTVVILDQKLLWEKRDKWIDKSLRVIDDVAGRTTPVGVVARNTEYGRIVKEWALKAGYRISYDVESLHIDPHADLWILVVGGRFYRGVSFKPLKGEFQKDKYDFNAAVAMYQHGEVVDYVYDDDSGVPKPSFKEVHPQLLQLIDDPWRYLQELQYAVNVQSLFRFNRYRDKEHVMVLLDKRVWHGIEHFLQYYAQTSRKFKCKDWDELRAAIRRTL